MEAARVSALRGHEVILYEKSRSLGGLLPMAALVKGLEIECLPAIVRYLKGQITKLGVKIKLGKKVTPSTIDDIKPDVVILATGGIPVTPEIKGINNSKVVSSARLHGMLKFILKFIDPQTLRWLTKLWIPVGKRVIIIGGGINGCELAEFLVKRGRKVTIVETADTLGEGMVNHLRLQLLWWFREKDVTMITGIKEYVEINDKGLVVLMPEGYKRTIEADSIIPAVPMKSDTVLFQELEGKVDELYNVGDCNEPKLIVDAIGDGFRVGRSI
jgi:2,4-dienoyl-CoA reductase (NADPH2)